MIKYEYHTVNIVLFTEHLFLKHYTMLFSINTKKNYIVET